MSDINSISVRDCLVAYGTHEWIVDAIDEATVHLIGVDGQQITVDHSEIDEGWKNLGPGAFNWS